MRDDAKIGGETRHGICASRQFHGKRRQIYLSLPSYKGWDGRTAIDLMHNRGACRPPRWRQFVVSFLIDTATYQAVDDIAQHVRPIKRP